MAARLNIFDLAYWIAFILLLALAFGLRASSAQNRPLHADEGVQAYTTAALQDTGIYDYAPEDRHGPTLYYFASWLNKLRGIDTKDLTDFDLRLLPIIFSIGSIWLIRFAFPQNWKAVLIASAILSTTPLAVIYGAYFIQESIFVFLSLAIAISGHRVLLTPSAKASILLGISIGLLQATKETSILIYGSIGLSLVIARFLQNKSEVPKYNIKRPALIVVGTAILSFVIFQSSFFSDIGAVKESLTAYFSYFDRAAGQGHEKPFGYYLSIFLSQPSIGLSWGEIPLLILILVGSIWTISKSVRTNNPTIGFICGTSGLILFLSYSLIPYKTPWLILAPITFLSISAAEFVADRISSVDRKSIRAGITLIAIASIVALELKPAAIATGRYATHEKNPYIYSHTTGQYSKLLERIAGLITIDPELKIAVLSPDNAWPLPWHLRNIENVGYWTSPIDNATDFDLVLMDSRIEVSPEASYTISETHIPDIHGLRPNTLLTAHIEKDLWDRYLDAN